MITQIPLPADAVVEDHAPGSVPDVSLLRTLLSNVVLVGHPGAADRRWLLIDAGSPGSASTIRQAAAQRFAPSARAFAIILTHGHFDHVGAVKTLADEWNCPVFAHPNEFPFLNGSRPYPAPNPWAGGFMSLLSPSFPRGPINLGRRLRPLPPDGSVPGMPRWRWIPTPGHTPGHISLWRDADRTLIAGDAVITTRQESAYAALFSQTPEMHGPPAYFTPDWTRAGASVRRLAQLHPETIFTGHGRPMRGRAVREALDHLARNFDHIAVPESLRSHQEHTG